MIRLYWSFVVVIFRIEWGKFINFFCWGFFVWDVVNIVVLFVESSEVVIFSFCLEDWEEMFKKLLEFIFRFVLSIDIVFFVYEGLLVDVFVCEGFKVDLKGKLILFE